MNRQAIQQKTFLIGFGVIALAIIISAFVIGYKPSTTCTNQCNENGRYCLENSPASCSDTNGNGCKELTLYSECASDEVCSNGYCIKTTTTTTATTIKPLTKFIVSASCDKTLGRLSLNIRNNVGESITLATIKIFSQGIMSIDPNDFMAVNSEKTYGNFPSSCPNSISLEIGYIDSTGSHKDTGTINVSMF